MPLLEPGSAIAFIGLGQMGFPMAKRLSEAGYSVTGFDVSAKARSDFSEVSSRPSATSATSAVTGARVAILMLPTSQIVRQVLIDDGLLEALGPGGLVIDMSSSEPLVTRELAGLAADRGLSLIDAPVSGGVRGAEQGTLTIMTGGVEHDLELAKAIFDVLGGKVAHVGPVGAGHALKALNNLLSATSLLVTAEAVEIGERFGLDPQVMIDAINTSSGRSFSTEMKFPTYVLPKTYNSGFALRLMAKDMRIAMGLGSAVGVESELGERSTGLWERAAAELSADADHTEIARWVRQQQGPTTSSSDAG